MAKWIQRTIASHVPTGNEAVIDFAPATEGNYLMLVASSSSVSLDDPMGWTLLASAVDDSSLYVWTKTAASGESSALILMSDIDYPAQAIVYEFPAGTSVLGASGQSEVSRTGVAVTGLSGLPLSAKLLMHFGGFVGSGATNHIFSTESAINGWANSTLSDAWVGQDGIEGVSYSTGLLAGYEEDSLLTSWAPVCYMDNIGDFHWNTERITLALEISATVSEPTAVYYNQATSSWESALPVVWDHTAGEWVESS